MVDLNEVLLLCSETEEKLRENTDNDKRRKVIFDHLDTINKKLKFEIPDFNNGLEWMNSTSQLSFKDNLQGKIVVLDFFTYCCINCMHVLPDLEALEAKYSVSDGVVVIGVHSAKFENEKISANILSAILRYNISHPVVNDVSATLWQSLQIQCWPTFVVVGPQGQYLYSFVGEGHRSTLLEFVSITVEYFKTQIGSHDLPLILEKERLPPTPLKFPGKICGSADGKTIIVSDTGHNRILVLGKDGIVQHVVGGTDRGFKDGNFVEARFNSPQGVTLINNVLYVADTENHAIRKVDLNNKFVTTVIGTGKQGQDKEGGKYGTEQEISSPWDLASGGSNNEVLFIAMAGTHQIWAYFIHDYKWFRGKEFKHGTCVRVAGSGSEENRNNSYPEKAAFAQPSGLALSTHSDLNMLYIADSESSSIRQMSLKDGAVKCVVGGERDPLNLFAYGDKDGIGIDAKLQHPLAVAMVTDDAGPLLVADSYNHKIKMVDLKTKMCTTIAGPDSASDYINVSLNEPGGLWVDKKSELVYITDTNNHCIRVMSLCNKSFQDLNVIFPLENPQKTSVKDHNIQSEVGINSSIAMATQPGSTVTVILYLQFPDGTHLTEDAPSSWILKGENEKGDIIYESKGKIVDNNEQVLTDLSLPNSCSAVKLYLKCKVMFCDKANLCHMKTNTYMQMIHLSGNNEEKSVVKFYASVDG